jgi:hypothetical protein
MQNYCQRLPKGLSIMIDNKDKALIYVINFFNSRMRAMSKNDIERTKELISTHGISASELVDKYVKLVYETA